jgi:epoxyqueuosine reductase
MLASPGLPDATPSAPAPDRLLAARVFREEAMRAGFARFGIAAAGEPPRHSRFVDWLDAGRHARMRYLEQTRAARADPGMLLPGARSVVCLASAYPAEPWVAADGSRFARYARGSDYHHGLRQKTLAVLSAARARLGSAWGARVCVDSTPLSERAFAAAAGLGWIGKNGCLIDEEHGSYLLLSEILTDLDLPADAPVAESCGTCTRCLDACPTDAFLEPGVLDAGRCLAYWTIEHRGEIPDPWKAAVGPRVFGCDVCQEVCPWNAPLRSLLPPAPPSREAAGPPPSRAEILAMGKGAWRRRFGRTAVNRAARRGLQRNAAASAGATRDAACRPALERAARVDEPGLSEAAAWALGRLPPPL